MRLTRRRQHPERSAAKSKGAGVASSSNSSSAFRMPYTFFDSLASTAWSSDPIAGRGTLGMRDLLSASTNGIPAETCDFDETLHASALPLEGQ